MNKNIKHFLTLMDFTPQELDTLIQKAIELKSMWKEGDLYSPLKNKTLAMIFD
ncbi:MAG TPA: ornithine carbamoyltransferase, partial [Thiothrix sp.]|nr:ornithine carbamoyltransferase [Thiothrix sp.]